MTDEDKQLTLWSDGELEFMRDARPLPLIVAAKWGFPLQFHGQEGDYRYALQDWVRGLLHSKGSTLREQVRRLLNDSDVTLAVTTEPYRAADGKTYQVPFVTDRDLYAAAQALRPLGSRTQLAEVHKQILDYLTRSGVFVDAIRRDPKRMAARLEGMVSRSEFTASLVKTVIDLTQGSFAIATNDVYKGLFHRTAAQLKSQLNAKNLRDAMSQPALHLTGLCEWLCAQQIGEAQTLRFEEARCIIQEISGMLGIQVDEIERRLGLDLVTGRKLLGSVDAIRGV